MNTYDALEKAIQLYLSGEIFKDELAMAFGLWQRYHTENSMMLAPNHGYPVLTVLPGQKIYANAAYNKSHGAKGHCLL